MKGVALGAAGSLACAPTIEVPPMLPPPVVASLLVSESHPSASLTLDTVVVAGVAPRSVVSVLGGGNSVQHMAAVHVIASARTPNSGTTPTPVERREPVTLPSIA